MFGGISYKLSMLRKKSSVGVDVTPDPIDFGTIVSSNSPIQSNTVTFTGINTNITITVNITVNDTQSIEYVKNGISTDITSFPSNFTIPISNNDTLYFSGEFSLAGGLLIIDVSNASDNDASLGQAYLERTVAE